MKNKYFSKAEIKADTDFHRSLVGWTIINVGITRQSLERFEDKSRYRPYLDGGLTFFLERKVGNETIYKKVVLDTVSFDTIVEGEEIIKVEGEEIIKPFAFSDHMEVLPTDSELLKEITEGLK